MEGNHGKVKWRSRDHESEVREFDIGENSQFYDPRGTGTSGQGRRQRQNVESLDTPVSSGRILAFPRGSLSQLSVPHYSYCLPLKEFAILRQQD